MENDLKSHQHQPKERTYVRRLDIYWKYTTIYCLVLFLYIAVRGTFSSGKLTLVLYDPVSILLGIFVIVSLFGLLFNFYKKRTIMIGSNFIIFKTRLREKKYMLNEISRISIGRAKVSRIRSRIKLIKIKVVGRRLAIKIRLDSFWDEKDLLNSIIYLKSQIKK